MMGTFMQQTASIGMTVLTMLSLAHAAFAPRQVAQTEQPERPQQQQRRPMAAIPSSELAQWLLSDHRANVNVVKFAQQRSQNDDVAKFAESIVKANSELIEHLEKHAGQQHQQRNGQRQPAVRQPAQAQPGQGAQQGQQVHQNGGHSPLATFKQELSQRFSQTMISELEKKQGAEFDRAFMGGEIFALLGMRDTYATAQQHADGEFAEVLKQGSQQVEQHLKQARQIMDQLEGTRGQGTAGRERPTQRQ